MKWFQLAGEQGLVVAQRKVGFIYVEGTGVPTDEIEGFAWLTLAAAAGSEDVKQKETRELLKKSLEENQSINAAQRRVNELFENYRQLAL